MSNPCLGPPIAADPADESHPWTDEELALVARALAHPARIKILRILAGHDTCTGADVFPEIGLAQSTISEHLRILKEAGVVSAAASGNHMCYCLVPAALVRLGRSVTDVLKATETERQAAASL